MGMKHYLTHGEHSGLKKIFKKKQHESEISQQTHTWNCLTFCCQSASLYTHFLCAHSEVGVSNLVIVFFLKKEQKLYM